MYELLSEPIRRYIRDKKWDNLRPIQAAAIQKVMQSENHLILASRTASGKTEAAFLPVLSKVDFNEAGVQVLYISPLIALINDQFFRVEELCAYLDVPVTKWHGEANATLKEKLIQNPRGIVLITPESIEAMLVNKAYAAKALFSNLKFIVIDEIHAFIGVDRGKQLQSLLHRLQEINTGKARIIGLSATIGDYIQAKQMTGEVDNTTVLVDKTSKEIESMFKYFEGDTIHLPVNLLKDLYLNVCDNKVLVFPNSRGKAEEVAVKLQKISEHVSGHNNYFSHHSSVDKELREYIEQFAKTNKRYPFTIACTSTLELGIDIGSVDKVVQIDATYSIASLIQRIGRSGRRENESSKLLLYATNPWSLLQAIACMSLFKEGFVEPVKFTDKPYDILLHQALAQVRQLSECTQDELVKRMSKNVAFANITVEEIQEIVQHLVQIDLLELLGGKLIIGVEGEKVVNKKEFYTVFKTDTLYKVRYQDKPIGEVPLSLQIKEDEKIFLSARIWCIIDVDHKAKRITVEPAKDGEKPLFNGNGADVDPKVRERMLQLLTQNMQMPDLSEEAREIIRQLKLDFEDYNIEDLTIDRPLKVQHTQMIWFSFHGSKVNRSLEFLFNAAGLRPIINEQQSSFKFDTMDMDWIIESAIKAFDTLDQHLEDAIEKASGSFDCSKYGSYLPRKYQIHLIKNTHFDFYSAMDFLTTTNTLTTHLRDPEK